MVKEGDVIGKYRIIKPLGKGGEGSIFLVMHILTRQLWALKRVKKTAGIEENEREIKMLRSLRHPNLPAVIDILETPDSICLILEYIRGQNLDCILKKCGRLKPAFVFELGQQLCDALSYLHSRTPPILHLDLKPANLILTNQGRLVLVDFGAAQRSTDRLLPRKGTEGFAAPEQSDLKAALDERADIYGIGAVLYCLVSGSVPGGDCRLPGISGCPDGLWRIMERCMRKDPPDRYRNAGQVRKALEQVQSRKVRERGRIRTGTALLIFIWAGIILSQGLHKELGQAAAVTFDYERLLESASCAPETERADLYMKALYMEPARETAWLQLLDEIMLDGHMTDTEDEMLRTILYTIPYGKEQSYEELLSFAPSAYGNVSFCIGLGYWYGYDDGNDAGLRIALGWFEKAEKAAGEYVKETAEEKDPAWIEGTRFYIRMGSSLREGITGEEYWHDLTALLEYDLNEMLSDQMKLTFFEDSMGQLTLYMQQILAGGVSGEALAACAEKMAGMAEDTEFPEGSKAAAAGEKTKERIRQSYQKFTEVYAGILTKEKGEVQ